MEQSKYIRYATDFHTTSNIDDDDSCPPPYSPQVGTHPLQDYEMAMLLKYYHDQRNAAKVKAKLDVNREVEDHHYRTNPHFYHNRCASPGTSSEDYDRSQTGQQAWMAYDCKLGQETQQKMFYNHRGLVDRDSAGELAFPSQQPQQVQQVHQEVQPEVLFGHPGQAAQMFANEQPFPSQQPQQA